MAHKKIKIFTVGSLRKIWTLTKFRKFRPDLFPREFQLFLSHEVNFFTYTIWLYKLLVAFWAILEKIYPRENPNIDSEIRAQKWLWLFDRLFDFWLKYRDFDFFDQIIFSWLCDFLRFWLFWLFLTFFVQTLHRDIFSWSIIVFSR